MNSVYPVYYVGDRFRKILALVLLPLIALFMLALMPLSAYGQNAEVKLKLSPEEIAQGRRFTEDLKVFASEKAEKGSARYWAIIRTNLPRVPVKSNKAGRGFTPTKAAAFSDDVSILPQDSDPEMQRTIKRKMRELSLGARIFGGKKVEPKKFDAVVALIKDGDAFCSGTYIGDRTVLTAAHCVCDQNLDNLEKPGQVAFGNDVNSGRGLRYDIIETALYDKNVCSNYSKGISGSLSGKDLAIVRFAYDRALGSGQSLLQYYTTKRDAAIKGDGIRPSPIAEWPYYFNPETKELHLVGFGYDEAYKSGIKRQVRVPITDRFCSNTVGCEPGKEVVLIDMITLKKDSCNGDSGGPAFIKEGTKNYLIGVTSRGVAASGACGHGGVYELITPSVINWLVGRIGIALSLCPAPERCVLRRSVN